MSQYPISKVCLSCSGVSHKRIAPEGFTIAYAMDRACKGCGTRYTSPTPGWAGAIFVMMGSLLVAANVVYFLTIGNAPGAPNQLPIGLVILGIGCIGYGIKSMIWPPNKDKMQ